MATVAVPTAYTRAALTSELTNNPNGLADAAGVTLTALKAAKRYDDAAALLNDPTKNPTQVVWNNAVTVNAAQAALNAAEYDTLSTNKLLQFLTMLAGPGTIDATNANVRAIFSDIFAGKTTTLANFVLAAQRAGSRAEALWGTGFAIPSAEVAAA
jgi:hypothetical protein